MKYNPSSISYIEPNTLALITWNARTMSTLVKVRDMYVEFNKRQMQRIANKVFRKYADEFHDGYRLSELLREEIVTIAIAQWLRN